MQNAPLRRSRTRLATALTMVLSVAALHIINLRQLLPLEWQVPYRSYFSDLAIPFAFYYLLCLSDDRVPMLRSRSVKALAVFLASTAAELLQGVGVPLLGRTFDYMDIGMYATGVALALGLDALVLSRALRAWPLSPDSPHHEP